MGMMKLLLVFIAMMIIVGVWNDPSVEFRPGVGRNLWEIPVNSSYQVCMGNGSKLQSSNGYLIVNTNGGLNQMRTGISDMVAIAKVMKATLVVPKLDNKSYWSDPSEFKDIFDVRHFIESLKGEVKVVSQFPRNITPFKKTPVSWSNTTYYTHDILPLLKKHRALQFTHTDTRLANNNLPSDIQRLRCFANFYALRYAKPIQKLGQKLIDRMANPYVALHLRYEKDMLSFTGCAHGLSHSEEQELINMRYNVSHWKTKEIDGEAKRKAGFCPLTPREATLLLKAFGYPRSTRIYLVAGEIFGNSSMEQLLSEYPNVYTHSTLATKEELQPFQGFQNRLAALDYLLALNSDVFIYTYGGNMAKALEGHRRMEGFRKTIIPKTKTLVKLIDAYDSGRISWKNFTATVQTVHKNRLGAPSFRQPGHNPKLEDYFYANPLPGCICKQLL